jgi:hypothetical protein
VLATSSLSHTMRSRAETQSASTAAFLALSKTPIVTLSCSAVRKLPTAALFSSGVDPWLWLVMVSTRLGMQSSKACCLARSDGDGLARDGEDLIRDGDALLGDRGAVGEPPELVYTVVEPLELAWRATNEQSRSDCASV